MSSIKNTLHLVRSVITPYFNWLPILLYLSLTLPALLDTDHVLKNLEPYPDGLLYALASKQAATDGRLALIYNGTELEYWVPPLYSIVLLPFYTIFNHTDIFYVANITLGVATVILLQRLLKFLTHSSLVSFLGTVVFVLHGFVLWLPTVPMAENLQLLLSMIALYVLLVPEKMNLKLLLVLSAVSVSFVLTKYVGVFTGLMFVLLGVYRARYALQAVQWGILVVFGAVGYALYWYVVQDPYVLLASFVSSVFSGHNHYVSTSYVLSNLEAYMYGLVKNGNFLWIRQPLTSYAIGFTVLGATCYFLYTKLISRVQVYLYLLLASTLVIPLFFYVVDTRYILLVVPFLVVLLSVQLEQLLSRQSLHITILSWSVLLILHVILQAPLLKQVIAANLFGRTTAWQYQAVQNFDTVFTVESEQEPILITALPPYLVATYQATNYRVVPLANTQEFLAKGEYVWGNDIDYNDLSTTYETWITEGKEVYITNAYITHQQSVITEFERYKEKFRFIAVSPGCSDACTIYKLEILEH